jgi:hypothetical protein
MCDLGDAIEHDPEVRQARRIADAARKRLVVCMTGSQDAIDPTEAQRMLDAFRGAVAHAEDAEDRVLLHRGLLTSVEAGRRAAHRRPVSAKADEQARTGQGIQGIQGIHGIHGIRGIRGIRGARRARRARRGGVARAVAWALAFAAAGTIGVALARWLGVRPPLSRW